MRQPRLRIEQNQLHAANRVPYLFRLSVANTNKELREACGAFFRPSPGLFYPSTLSNEMLASRCRLRGGTWG